MYITTNEKSSMIGAVPVTTRLHSRCYRLTLTVPATYAALEEDIRRWISTCVMSRTQVRPGVPIRRERELVTGNPSLRNIWDRVLQHRKSQRVEIRAEYIWGAGRVESINFSTSALQPPAPHPSKPQCRKEGQFMVCKQPCPPGGFSCNGFFCERAPGADDPSRPNECWYAPILTAEPYKPPPPNSQPSVLNTYEPLPPSEFHRFQKAIEDLQIKALATQDPRRWRYLCWIQKLKKPDVDDRIILWSRICPKLGAIGAAYLVGPCDLFSKPVDQTTLQRSIRSVSDVEVANRSLKFITHMRSAIVFSFEMTSAQLENLRMKTDDAGLAIDKLDIWANNPMGGSSAMPLAYRAIKDWIRMRQQDPKSLYSCR